MNEQSASEKTGNSEESAATSAGRETVVTEIWNSKVYVEIGDFVEEEDDGRFELTINGQDVTGTHYRADGTAQSVTGKVKDSPAPRKIRINATDNSRSHVGFFKTVGSEQKFIGIVKIRRVQLGPDQEQGTWIGTKG